MNPADIFPAGQAPARPKSYVDVTESTFQAEVVERSQQVPVVIDFWAAWCAPCRQLGPVLERLAEEAAGAWALAKVDVDANQRLAQAFRIQGIPAVKAVVGGALVSEFTGALPERDVRAWLATLPAAAAVDPAAEQVARGAEAESRGDLDAAEAAYRAALAEAPGSQEAAAGLARIALARRAASADPSDLYGAADVEFARGEVDRAFDRLLGVVRANEGPERDKAREHLLGLLATLPPDDARAARARRELAAALF